MDPIALAIPLSLATVGGVVWLVRLEGRINVHDELFDEREKQADDRHADFKSRLTRIETKIDTLAYVKKNSLGQ
jgi:hypothetical protein